MFRRSAASEEEDGYSSRSRSRSAAKHKQAPSQRSDLGERISRILRSTPSQQHLPPVPSVSTIAPSTPTAAASTSRNASLPTSTHLDPTSSLSKFSGSPSAPPPRPSPSIDSFLRRQSLVPLTPTSPIITHTPAPNPVHSSPSATRDDIPTTSAAPLAWDSAIADRLRAMSSNQLPTGYFSTTDGDNTETEWETDAGGISIPRFQGTSSDYGMPYSSDDDGDSRGFTSTQKGKGRAASTLQPPTRSHTLSNASSASSLGTPRSRVASTPPPVPSLPAEFSSLRSRRKPHLSVNTNHPSSPPAEDSQEPVAIAVIGAPGCGKSDFVWKGMKGWGLSPHQNVYDYSGIPVSTRSALLAARQSFFTPSDGSGGGGATQKENEIERKKYFRVTILEVSSAPLLENVPSSMEEIRAGDGLWAWPTTLPKVDGILVCYDVNDPSSFGGVNELCAAYYSLRIPTVIVQCKSDLEQIVPAEHVASRASGYSIGLVVTSTRTDAGKKKAKDSFGWLMKSIWRKRRGKESDDSWNPASPDVLTSQSWEFEDAVNIPPSPPQVNSSASTRSATPTGIGLRSTTGSRRGTAQHSANSGSISSLRKPPSVRGPPEPATHPVPPTSPTVLLHPNSPTRTKSTPDLARLVKRTSAVRFAGVVDSDPDSPVRPPAESSSQTSASAIVARQISVERPLRSSVSMSDLRLSETPTPTQTLTPIHTPPPQPHLTQVQRDAVAEAEGGGVTVALLLPKLRRPLNPMQFATFDEIITKLVYLAVTEEDPTPIDAFFATYRRFSTPRAVLVAFKKRLIVLSHEPRDPTTARLAEMKIAGLIENWLYQFPNDFSGKPANLMFLDIIRLMMRRPHLAHYASDLYPWASKVLNRRDPDIFWTVREDEQGYGADTEEAEDEYSRRTRRQEGNEGVHVAVTTTTTIETDDEQEPLSSTPAVSSTPSRHHRSVRSSAFATKSKKTEPPPMTPKGAKRSRSTSNFAPSYIENLLGASSSRRMMEPLPPDASTKAILRELNKAADQILRMKAQEVAEEITRTHTAMFLTIKPRHWLQHVFRPPIELADDDPGPPPQQPMDTIDNINYLFNRLGEWTTSVILGPDGFMRRAKVAEHFISIALALRRLNNYFGAHALTNGIRGTLADGDILGMKVAETPDFKLFLSMEKLFNSYGSFSAYRLALRNSHGPVIPDLSIHTPDMGRTNVIPNRKIGDPERLNWGKFMQLGRGVRHIQAFQKRFEDWSSHEFIERPFIKAMLQNSPVLEEEIKHRRSRPMVPEDGSENPTAEKVKRFLGI